ncbi:hypothetical protein SteCoe_3070 [Stentor coeruleus]|uniref:Palmitoyltransferase n=1 Tax=Stentor coeruleus TaxID=5963 RepID=A0A1R2CXY4_9CILI|nr:hypothetical protein SteCoe_3070 [Stentor coeruleus]
MRKHGFQLPLNKYQFIGIGLFFGVTLVFYLQIYPLLSYMQKLIIGISFALVDFFAFVFYVITTLIDPSDITCKQSEDFMYCTLCNAPRSIGTKHCTRCNRCTNSFDHHCKWINNCVGKKNYKEFLMMIILIQILCLFFIGSSVFAIIRFTQRPKNEILGISVLATFMIPCVFTFGFLAHLTGFHVYLLVKKMSTYEYVISKKKKAGAVYHSAEKNIDETIVRTEISHVNKDESLRGSN